jgi:NADH:ubiquinone oxidoreductase subunit K
MSQVPISWFLAAQRGALRAGCGGILFRRNIITVFMSIELMLNAVNLTFIAFAYQQKQVDGHILRLLRDGGGGGRSGRGAGHHFDRLQEPPR